MDPNQSTIDQRLADFTQDKRILLLSIMAIFIGILGALVAKVLMWLIAVISNYVFFQEYSTQIISPVLNHLGPWIILIPALGGLVIGFMARYGSDKIRGHGIPEALEAILFGKSLMNPKVAILKPISSAISIGTGGPFGAEGPIIMTGGALGSLVSQLFKLSSAERKTLLVAGAAAGMAAIFATPIAAVLLAVELLLFEWKPRSFIPVAIASGVAAICRVPLLGAGPIFATAPYPVLIGPQYVAVFLVGIVAGLAATLITFLVYRVEDLFEKLHMHWMWWPMIGGLLVGIIGYFDPRVLGVGYDIIHHLLEGSIPASQLLSLTLGKTFAWSIALGSGTSGGVLAPLLMIGGGLGGMLATVIPFGSVGLWSALSMAAVMGGAMGAPLTAILFTFEVTHEPTLLLPLLVACVASYFFSVFVLRRSILTEKIARRGYHIMREYGVDPLSMIRVKDVMDTETVGIPESMTIQELADRIVKMDPLITRHKGIPILDEVGHIKGIITHSDVVCSLEQEREGHMTVLEAGTKKVFTVHPDELLSEALYTMVRNDIGRLLVVSPEDPSKLVGYLGRAAIITARSRQVEEEFTRAFGWRWSASS